MKPNPILEKIRAEMMRALNSLPKGYTVIVMVSEPEPNDGDAQSLQFINGDIGDFHANIFDLLQTVHEDDFDSILAEKLAEVMAELSKRYSAHPVGAVN